MRACVYVCIHVCGDTQAKFAWFGACTRVHMCVRAQLCRSAKPGFDVCVFTSKHSVWICRNMIKYSWNMYINMCARINGSLKQVHSQKYTHTHLCVHMSFVSKFICAFKFHRLLCTTRRYTRLIRALCYSKYASTKSWTYREDITVGGTAKLTSLPDLWPYPWGTDTCRTWPGAAPGGSCTCESDFDVRMHSGSCKVASSYLAVQQYLEASVRNRLGHSPVHDVRSLHEYDRDSGKAIVHMISKEFKCRKLHTRILVGAPNKFLGVQCVW